jgi:hypothetical protein
MIGEKDPPPSIVADRVMANHERSLSRIRI